jgi:hypothetical protein
MRDEETVKLYLPRSVKVALRVVGRGWILRHMHLICAGTENWPWRHIPFLYDNGSITIPGSRFVHHGFVH